MTSLYIDRSGVEVRLDGGALVFYEGEALVGTVPIAPLSRVFLRGNATLSTSVLGKLGEAGVGVVVLSGKKAEPTLFMGRPHNDAARRVAQYKASLLPDFVRIFSSGVVERKLLNQRSFLEELASAEKTGTEKLVFGVQRLDECLERLKSIGPGVDASVLRGIEGRAAKDYFEALGSVLPKSIGFSGRNRRPPKDPFNVVLSLGYTLLHAETVRVLYGVGLDPFVGFYHALDFGRESLACDLVEPFRPFVDRYAFRCFRERVLRPEDFSLSGDACLLGKAGRGRFYPAWEEAAGVLRPQLEAAAGDLANSIADESAGRSVGSVERTA